MIGDLVLSKKGHDKDKRYIIIKEEKEYVYLADGILKTLEHPKKKRKKHIQPIYCYDTTQVKDKLLSNQKISDVELKRVIKLSMREKENREEDYV